MSPRKVRLIIDVIRGMNAKEAEVQLQFLNKKASAPVLKLLRSAMANAVQNSALKKESLVVSSAFVDGGPILYRWMPRAFGRASHIRKRTSHITIVLSGEVDDGVKKKAPDATKVQAS